MTTINPATSVMTPITKPITPKGGAGAIDFSSLITAANQAKPTMATPIKRPPMTTSPVGGDARLSSDTFLNGNNPPMKGGPVHAIETGLASKTPSAPKTPTAPVTIDGDVAHAGPISKVPVMMGRGGEVSCPTNFA